MTTDQLRTILEYLETTEDDFAIFCAKQFERSACQSDQGERLGQELIYEFSQFIRNCEVINEFLMGDETI